MPEYSLKIIAGILLVASLGPVWAHSFNLGLVIPMSGPRVDTGQQALDGFMLATTEQDGHPDETSDGHLGGLDSHVLKVDSGVGSDLMLKSLEGLMQKSEPVFVTGLFSGETAKLVSKSLKQQNTVFFDPTDSAMWQIALSTPVKLKSMNGDSFSARFQNRYGYAPTPEVNRGYIAARLIAATVRSLSEEQLDDSATVRSTLHRLEAELR